MWKWTAFVVIPILMIAPGNYGLYEGISSDDLYSAAFAYWNLNSDDLNSGSSGPTPDPNTISDYSFCSINGIDELNGAVEVQHPALDASDNWKSPKITLSSYPTECPTDPLSCEEGFTVSFWLSLKRKWLNETLDNSSCMLLSLNDTSSQGFEIQFNGMQGTISFRALGTTISSAEAYNVADQWIWNHFGMTWNNQTRELTVYVDGENSGNKMVELNGEGDSFYPASGGCSYVALDEIAIWERPLNKTEMKALRLDPFNFTETTTPAATTVATATNTKTTPPLETTPESSTEPVSTAVLETTTKDETTPESSTEPVLTAGLETTTKDETTPESPTESVSTAGMETTTKLDTSTPSAVEHSTLSSVTVPLSTTVDIKTTVTEPQPTGKSVTTSDTTAGKTSTKPFDITLPEVENLMNRSSSIAEVVNHLTFVGKYVGSYGEQLSQEDGETIKKILLITSQKLVDLLPTASKDEKQSILEIYMGIVDGMLEINKNITDKSLRDQSIIEGTSLIGLVDDLLSVYLDVGSDSEFVQVVPNPLVDTELAVFESPSQTAITLTFKTSDDANKVVIIIPGSIYGSGTGGRVAATSYYDGIQEHLPAKLQGKKGNYNVSGSVVGINVNAPSTYNFDDKVSITITHPKITDGEEAVCAYLKRVEGKDAVWSTEGCTTVSTEGKDSTTCECDHLTNFAVLVSTREIILSTGDTIALEILTNLGLAISIICLTLTLIILNVLRQLNSTRISILKHTAAALLAAQVLFIIGSMVAQFETFCKVVAALTHYAFLAVFCWMLVQGVHLYMKVRRALKGHIDMIYFYIFGWGFPLVVVAISFGVAHVSYGTEKYCWISLTDGVGVLMAFIGPAYFILAINFVVVCMVMHVFMTVKVNKDKSEKDKIKSGIKAVIVMVPILGLTWLFGLLMITSDSVVFIYLFVIFNCAQGLFIFLFHVVHNDEVKQAIAKKRNKVAAAKDSNTLFSKVLKTSKGTDHSTTEATSTLTSGKVE